MAGQLRIQEVGVIQTLVHSHSHSYCKQYHTFRKSIFDRSGENLRLIDHQTEDTTGTAYKNTANKQTNKQTTIGQCKRVKT